ncbi:uncharacterized protein B0T15DRAFT_395021, partial [Chaetomium strumarium]
GTAHHPTYESLKGAIDQCCSLCIALLEMLAPEQQDFLMDPSRPHKDGTSATLPKHPLALTNHTQSPETLALAKRWFSDCVRHHKRCTAASRGGPWYPTRLLDLSRIVHDGTEPSSDQIRTYPHLATGVPVGSLPRLMRDAIFISLELGIRYLWVDLLCIYQGKDDITDWQREAALMDRVYANTFCNISAGDANGCLESLFSPRDPNDFLPQLIELQLGDREDETGLFRVHDLDYWRRSISRAPVNTRAWVLQERFLSPRVLQFDRRQVLWECLEVSATDTCPKHIPMNLMGRDYLLFKSLVPIAKSESPPESERDVRRTWIALVREYTACGLTVPGDKLIAISGIARHLATFVEDEFSLGKTTRPAEYRAPSWSWASIEGPVRPGLGGFGSSLITVEEVQLEYLTGDVFGAVTGGWLRLRGPLRQLQLVRNNGPDRNPAREWDMILEGVNVAMPETQPPHEPYGVEVRLDTLHESFAEQNASDTLFAMLARNIIIKEGHKDAGHGHMHILLFNLVDKENAVFERIGLAKTWHSAYKEAILKAERPRNAPALPGVDCGNGVYSICVI